MDKSWMNIYDRINDTRYEAGVIEFLDFAYRGRDESLAIPCPCRSCNNFRDKNRETMYNHLMQNGITRGYTTWNYHGEESDDDDDDDDGGDGVPFDGSDGGGDDISDDDLGEMLDNIGQSTWG
ncbi:Myb domain protein 62 [Tanacetum coccineum]